MVRGEVALRDGTPLSETMRRAVAKFAKLAGSRLPAAQVERVRDLVLGLERLDDAKDVAVALALQQ